MNQPIIPAGMDLAGLNLAGRQINELIEAICTMLVRSKMPDPIAAVACLYVAGIAYGKGNVSDDQMIAQASDVLKKGRSSVAQQRMEQALRASGIIRQ